MQVICVFPGQGSQSVGMGKALSEAFPEVNAVFEEASDTLKFNMKALCFEDAEKKLNLTEFTQPALLTASVATFRVMQKRGIVPMMVAGHSLGEYSAATCVGSLKFSDALKAVHFRGQAMQRAVPVGVGAMAACLGTQGDKISELVKQISTPDSIVEVANYNSPGQLVLSGHASGIEKATKKITEEKLARCIPLSVSAPFHSSLMKAAANEMAEYLKNVTLQPNTEPLVANVDAKFYGVGKYQKELLINQVCSSVLWTQTLTNMDAHAEEATWVEVGTGNVLQGLFKKTLAGKTMHGTNDDVQLSNFLKAMGL